MSKKSKEDKSAENLRLNTEQEDWKAGKREEISQILEGKPDPSEINPSEEKLSEVKLSEETNGADSSLENNKGEPKEEKKKRKNESFGSASNPYVR